MSKLGQFAAACAAVLCVFSACAAEVAKYYEYVETDGDGTTTKGVLVSLDYIPTWQSVVEVKLKDLARSTTTGLFCSRTKNGKDGPLDNFSCICPNGTYRWDYGTIDSSKTATAPTDVHTVTCRPDGLCIDGVSQVTRTPKAVSDEPKPVHKLLLFGSYNGTEGDPEPVYPPANQYPSSAHMQVYSVKIWDDNGATLKVNLRPCVDTDGKAALYDAVGKNLYYGVTYGSSKGLTVGGGEVIYDGPDVKRKVAVSSRGAGTAVVSGDGWFAEGDPVTVTATPQDGAAFHHWEGDVPAGRANDATLVFPMGAGPRNLTAVFGSIYYVSTNGVAGATGTADDPFPTLEEALTHTTDYDTVKVCEGTYEVPKSAGARMSGTYSIANGIPAYWLTNAVTVVGVSGAEKTVFDGKGKNNCFAFILDNAEARVEGVTVCRIYTTIRYEVKESPAFEVKNGTLVNCVARDMDASTDATCLYYVGGINLRKGTLVGCRVSNVRVRDGLSLSAGINRTEGDSTCYITNCIVEGCKGKQGAGMLLQKPTKVYGCVVRNCTIETSSRGQMGPLAVNNGSVTVENCVITNNSGRSGGGVYIAASGIVRNCLIADNTCTDATGGGGVRISAGTLECCTVVGNTVDASLGAKGDGVYQTKGTIRNCIIAMNGKNRLQANDLNHYKSDGTCTYTCTYPTSVTGDGNVWEDPMFADLAGHDYRLSNLSSLFDIGSNQTWMETATDLDGNVRIEHEIVNPGCYETPTPAVKPLTCSFVADVLEGGRPLAVTFTSSVKNPGDTVEYAWTFGDGGESTEANPVHTYAVTGIYDVQLVVKSGDRSFTSRLPGLIKVGTPIAYVSNTGSGTWPYDTPEKATNDVNEVVQWLYKDGENYGRLVFRDGTYSPKEVLRITRPKIRFECENGPGRVFLNGSKLKTATYGVISIQEATAVVDGLVFTNCSCSAGTQTSHGSALTISAGTATNCTIAKCDSGTYTTSPLYMTGGMFTHGLIWGGSNYDSGAGGGGRAGFYMNGSSAKLLDTVVSNNYAGPVAGGQIQSGLISNCTFVANRCTSADNGNCHGILHVSGGTVANTKVIGNTYASPASGVIELGGGTMRNCLVADNVADRSIGGVYVNGAATLENCTIAGNEVKTEGKRSGLYVGDVKATIRNVLVAGNTGSTNEFRLGETATVTTGLFGVDPHFRNPARGNYRIKSGSPAQNAGTNQAWMEGAADLQGNPRILNGTVDIGCYEVPVTGLMLIVR